eukprot:s7175_g1.t1
MAEAGDDPGPRPRWKPEFGLNSSLALAWFGGQRWKALMLNASTEFQNLIARLAMVHSQEMTKVRMENADLKAQLYGTKSDSLGRVTKSTSLRSRPKSSVVAEFRQTSSTRPTMHSVQSEPTGAELPDPMDFATQTVMRLWTARLCMEEKLQREKAEENEKASKTASTVMDQLRQFLQSNYFDAIISCVLFANVMFLATQLQMEGSRVGYDIDYYPTKNPNDSAWPG